MYSRLIKPPQAKSFFLFGPRGTGKTTWVKNTFPHAVYIDLLETEIFNDLSRQIEETQEIFSPFIKIIKSLPAIFS